MQVGTFRPVTEVIFIQYPLRSCKCFTVKKDEIYKIRQDDSYNKGVRVEIRNFPSWGKANSGRTYARWLASVALLSSF